MKRPYHYSSFRCAGLSWDTDNFMAWASHCFALDANCGAALLRNSKFWFYRAKLRWSFLLVGWKNSALTFWSREENRFLSSAFLSSFLYLHIQFIRKRGFLSNSAPVKGRLGSRLPVIFKSDFRLQYRDRCRHRAVVPTGLQWLRNAEARASFVSADTRLLQACCSGTLLLLWSWVCW